MTSSLHLVRHGPEPARLVAVSTSRRPKPPLTVSIPAISVRNRPSRADLSIQHSHFFECHPQVRQGEQGLQLRRVLRQPAIANLHVPELMLDHTERECDLGADAAFDLLQLLLHAPNPCRLVQNLVFAWLHGHVLDRRPTRVGALLRNRENPNLPKVLTQLNWLVG
jgi:hypothetical protein